MNQLNKIEKENISFVIENISANKNLQDLKTLAINQWHEVLRKQIQEKMGKTIRIKLNYWGGLPAMRFSCEDWTSNDNDVVLYLSGNNNEGIIKYFALLESKDTDMLKKADEALREADDSEVAQPCIEGVYRTYECHYSSLDNIEHSLYRKMKLLDTFYHKNIKATE